MTSNNFAIVAKSLFALALLVNARRHSAKRRRRARRRYGWNVSSLDAGERSEKLVAELESLTETIDGIYSVIGRQRSTDIGRPAAPPYLRPDSGSAKHRETM